MKTSEQIDKIAEALAKAQGSMTNPDKNKTVEIPTKNGGKYKYRYAELPEIINTTRKALSENGLSHAMGLTPQKDFIVLTAKLMHSSGQWLQSEYEIPRNSDPKLFAAAMTYGRRYLFTALTGVAADEDTDEAPEPGANYSDSKSSQEGKNKPHHSPIKPNFKMGEQETAHIKELSERAHWSKEKLGEYTKSFNKRFLDLNQNEFEALCTTLEEEALKLNDHIQGEV